MVNAGSACPSHCEITTIGTPCCMHRTSRRYAGHHAGGSKDLRLGTQLPPVVADGIGVIRAARFVHRHMLAGPVVRPERRPLRLRPANARRSAAIDAGVDGGTRADLSVLAGCPSPARSPRPGYARSSPSRPRGRRPTPAARPARRATTPTAPSARHPPSGRPRHGRQLADLGVGERRQLVRGRFSR